MPPEVAVVPSEIVGVASCVDALPKMLHTDAVAILIDVEAGTAYSAESVVASCCERTICGEIDAAPRMFCQP